GGVIALARFEDQPLPGRGTAHAEVGDAVTVEVRGHGNVAGLAPLEGDGAVVPGGRGSDVPVAVARSPDDEVGPAIAVDVPRNGNTARHAPLEGDLIGVV